MEARLTVVATLPAPPPTPTLPPTAAPVLRVRLIGKSNGVGLSRDFELLAGALRAAHCAVTSHSCERRDRRRRRALSSRIAARLRRHYERALRRPSQPAWDVNVMLEHVWPQFLHQARYNVVVPNCEWFDRRDLAMLDILDRVWTKSALAQQLFTARGCVSREIGFDSEDRYQPQIARQHQFLHLAGRSPLKGTRRLLALWRSHPEWPCLTVVQDAGAPLGADELLALPNVRYERGYLDDATLRTLQNAHRFHLCPSEAEGWGHYIAEAMGVGAVTLTTDAAPMNELISPDRGMLVGSQPGKRHNLVRLALFDEAALVSTVQRCLSLDTAQLEAMGAAARAWFVANKHGFAERVQRAIAELTAPAGERGT